MKEHSHFEDLLPFYVSGQLAQGERLEIERHLADCPDCRADLQLWTVVSSEVRASARQVPPPPDLATRVLEQVQIKPARRSLRQMWRHTWQLLRAQFPLVQHELWPASGVVMLLGVVVALLSRHVEAVYFVAPLVAAASLTVLFGPGNDPAYELVAATPTSPWRVLLARLSIVSAYNMLLAVAAGLLLLLMVPSGLFGALILGWLGPMAFLSALALLLSLWIGTGNAVTITYFLWVLQYVPFRYLTSVLESSVLEPVFIAYRAFWNHPLLLISLSILLILFSLWSVQQPIFRLRSEIG